MKNKVIIGLVILILGVGAAVMIAGNSQKDDAKTGESVIDQSQQVQQQVSPTQVPSSISPSQTPVLSPTGGISPAAGQTFEVRGAITSVSGNTFVVGGRTIVIDPARVVNFQQTTSVTVGNQVKVEGSVIAGTSYAREIKSLAEDNSGSGSSGKN